MLKPVLFAALLLPTPALADWNRIDDAKELKRYVVGKDFQSTADKTAWFRINRNGSIDGGWKKASLTGKWKFEGGYLCSFDRVLAGKKQKNDCAVVRVKGRALQTIRAKGKGRSAEYRRR